jgi:hypothetical protein
MFAQGGNHNPTWWTKYQGLLNNRSSNDVGFENHSSGGSLTAGSNVDMSNECGPQSETFIAINPSNSRTLAAGSNEIFRLPMRGYYSTNNGSSWGGVDLPLPTPIGNGIDFGSDPSLAFDTRGNNFYSYIVVFFGNGTGVNGSEMAVATSSNGGRTYPNVAFFGFLSGSDHFNDKPMITTDTNASSPYRDHVYVAWDASSGGSSGGGVRFGVSSDHGASFTQLRIDNPSGPGHAIGAVPFVGPSGEVYAAWNDYSANVIAFNRSFNGGASWDTSRTIATKTIAFDIGIPAEEFRRALIYPACAADISSGPHRGRLYCSWIDLSPNGVTTDIYLSYSDNQGSTWSTPRLVADQLPFLVDRFNHWLAVDPVTGDVNLSFYDTRNDTTGSRYMTDTYFTQSTDGGNSWLSPNLRVSSASSNEHDCNGLYPCNNGIDYGNQQGDYEGLASFDGTSHPIWTDSRLQLAPASGCSTNALMEEVFTAAVK